MNQFTHSNSKSGSILILSVPVCIDHDIDIVAEDQKIDNSWNMLN